ncbi:MAG: M18 family aminopeptidase [Clostridia bacterium]|nr:M18 family aminopeptidase [Clostridia bacterium]
MNQALFDYIKASPTAYHAVSHTADILKQSGYTELYEHERWELEDGCGYFVIRNGSSLIAFRTPTDPENMGSFMMTAAHGDSPSFKIKENAELCDGHHLRLSVEKYGGMLCASWTDRPLSVAGRVLVRDRRGLTTGLVDLDDPCAIIPNVAIHMNRGANDGMSYNPAVDMLPLCGEASDAGFLRKEIADELGIREEDILATDLFLYNPQAGVEWSGYISAPRLDDLQCAFTSLTAFLNADTDDLDTSNVPVFCLFDNEEVGSQTKQGAASTFLFDTLLRFGEALGLTQTDLLCKLASSFLVSCDNAHAVHPNHPEYQDKNHAVYMNGGVVVKYNANQRYTTDGVSAAIFGLICERAGVPIQRYANRADMPGGSTLGNIANTRVSLNTIDIGLAQLAMHSAYETAGARDTEMMVRALTAFFQAHIRADGDGAYTLL